jgi:hypothetical protein
LGMQLFSQIVMRTSVKAYLGASMPAAQLSRCWAHSMACAEISKILALRLDESSDDAYSAGLLHDLGRFGLALAMPAQYAKLSRPEGFVDDADAEIRHFGTMTASTPTKAASSPSSTPLAPWPAFWASR